MIGFNRGNKEFFMKSLLKTLGIIALAALIGLTMTACPDDSPKVEPDFRVPLNQANFVAEMNRVRGLPGVYLYKLTSDIADFAGVLLGQTVPDDGDPDDFTPGEIRITLDGEGRTITWKPENQGDATIPAFRVGNNVTLILRDIKIISHQFDPSVEFTMVLGMIRVNAGGYLEIHNGTELTNQIVGTNTKAAVSIFGGEVVMKGGSILNNIDTGVLLRPGAEFTMEGGSITHTQAYLNSFNETNPRLGNYGVDMAQAGEKIFTMSGGTISNHIATAAGTTTSGVRLHNNGDNHFVMKGGTISNNFQGIFLNQHAGNSVSIEGGVIDNNDTAIRIRSGTVEMSGGTIKNSTSSELGAVRMQDGNGTFTMSGGTIEDNVFDGMRIQNGTFNMSGGTIGGNGRGNPNAVPPIPPSGYGVRLIPGNNLSSSITKTGGVIYGNAGNSTGNDKANADGSIQIRTGPTNTGLEFANFVTAFRASDNISGTLTNPSNVGNWEGSTLPGQTPSVESITVTRQGGGSLVAITGGTLQLEANVSVLFGADRSVAWSVAGGIAGTEMDSTVPGLLKVAAGETATSLTVRATSTFTGFTHVFGEAAVSVTSDATVDSVTIDPKTPNVLLGATQDFTVTFATTGTISQAVTWGLAAGGDTPVALKAGTRLVNETDAGARLEVDEEEENKTLIVTVTSVADTTKSDTATVNVVSFVNDTPFTFNPDTGAITGYTGDGGVVVIPSSIGGIPVTTIGGLRNNTNIQTLYIPNNVGVVYRAFYQPGANLVNLHIGNDVNMAIAENGTTNLTAASQAFGMAANTDMLPIRVLVIGDRVALGGGTFRGTMPIGSVVVIGTGVTTGDGNSLPRGLRDVYDAAGGGAGTYINSGANANTWTKSAVPVLPASSGEHFTINPDNGFVTAYTGPGGLVVIPSVINVVTDDTDPENIVTTPITVTRVGTGSNGDGFRGNGLITSLSIPSNVGVMYRAFMNPANLVTLHIGNDVNMAIADGGATNLTAASQAFAQGANTDMLPIRVLVIGDRVALGGGAFRGTMPIGSVVVIGTGVTTGDGNSLPRGLRDVYDNATTGGAGTYINSGTNANTWTKQ
jgi:hypothetical protein